jgi:general secretion pathway protein I
MFKKIQQGFTVLEVMVALFIIAVSLGGAIYSVGRAASNEKIIGDQTFARWVAMNQIAEEKIKRSFPKVGDSNGTETMAGITWKWQQKTLSTEIQNVRRIEVSVWQKGFKKKGVSAKVVGFLTKQSQ